MSRIRGGMPLPFCHNPEIDAVNRKSETTKARGRNRRAFGDLVRLVPVHDQLWTTLENSHETKTGEACPPPHPYNTVLHLPACPDNTPKRLGTRPPNR